MTDLLIRAFSRRPLRTLARPSAVLAFTLAVAYGCGFWLNLLHRAEGGTERNEPGVLLHWLRDSTLSLPLVFTAVWLGILLARRVIRRHGADLSAGLAGAVVAGTVALTTALALGASSPMHAGLFGASHGGPELPYALHLVRDALLSLAVTLPLCAVVAAALLRRQPWAEPQIARWRSMNARQRHGFQAAVTLVLVAPVFIFAQGAAETATAGSGAGAPCPASSPTKRFDVTALDVKIPLNRFGDNDPQGKMFALTSRVDDVRAQERSQKVSIGLHGDDAIQPLVIRANMGDCVEIAFANDASGGDYGVHIDGLAHDVASSGDAIGDNEPSGTERGEKRLYRFYVPDDPELEGTHYVRPGPGYRQAVVHGLFGALSVEPRGSVYLHPETRKPLESGWEAIIQPPAKKAFREYALLHHEIGNEDEKVFDKQGADLPMKDPHTTSYRPGARAINYRSEPFMNRLERADLKAFSYNSYTFGDPATPMPRGYLGDPTKIRIMHGGTELFHVYHLHGGGIRWRLNPHLDKTYDYEDTGLNKHPKTASSPSTRLDSQAFGPGESYDLEIEGGVGGVQQSAGDFLFHCHIVEHYVSGMWSFWRAYDTKQPDLAVLA
jgi:manganese oxidase